MSLSSPSHVSPTTGSAHDRSSSSRPRTECATSASRTTPTLCVLVSAIGVVSRPDSRTHSSPVSSPLPLSVWQPANSCSTATSASLGTITVTPVRTASPSMSVTEPTLTPATSVIASSSPGAASPKTIPRSRERGTPPTLPQRS